MRSAWHMPPTRIFEYRRAARQAPGTGAQKRSRASSALAASSEMKSRCRRARASRAYWRHGTRGAACVRLSARALLYSGVSGRVMRGRGRAIFPPTEIVIPWRADVGKRLGGAPRRPICGPGGGVLYTPNRPLGLLPSCSTKSLHRRRLWHRNRRVSSSPCAAQATHRE